MIFSGLLWFEDVKIVLFPFLDWPFVITNRLVMTFYTTISAWLCGFAFRHGFVVLHSNERRPLRKHCLKHRFFLRRISFRFPESTSLVHEAENWRSRLVVGSLLRQSVYVDLCRFVLEYFVYLIYQFRHCTAMPTMHGWHEVDLKLLLLGRYSRSFMLVVFDVPHVMSEILTS